MPHIGPGIRGAEQVAPASHTDHEAVQNNPRS